MKIPIMREPLRPIGVMVGVCALILGSGALYFAHSVSPDRVRLVHHCDCVAVPKPNAGAAAENVALAISLMATAVIVAAFGSVIAWGLGRVVRSVVNDAARLQALYGQMSDWLESHGIVLAGLWADHFNVGWMVRLLQDITGRVNSTLTFLLIVLTYVMLGLLEVDDVARRLGTDGRAMGKVLLVGGAKTAAKLRRYMLVRTQMSIMTGVLVWAFAMLGLALAVEWGVIAFALNYIPFIGPFIATVFPTLYAMGQFGVVADGCRRLCVPERHPISRRKLSGAPHFRTRPVDLAVGRSVCRLLLDVPVGIAGTFIGVPIMIAVLTMCEQHKSSRWVADLPGAPADKPD